MLISKKQEPVANFTVEAGIEETLTYADFPLQESASTMLLSASTANLVKALEVGKAVDVIGVQIEYRF